LLAQVPNLSRRRVCRPKTSVLWYTGTNLKQIRKNLRTSLSLKKLNCFCKMQYRSFFRLVTFLYIYGWTNIYSEIYIIMGYCSESWISWSLNVGPMGCFETSARNYNFTLRSIPQGCRSNLHRGGNFKSHKNLQEITRCLGLASLL
jgi:hypothetical protein